MLSFDRKYHNGGIQRRVKGAKFLPDKKRRRNFDIKFFWENVVGLSGWLCPLFKAKDDGAEVNRGTIQFHSLGDNLTKIQVVNRLATPNQQRITSCL